MKGKMGKQQRVSRKAHQKPSQTPPKVGRPPHRVEEGSGTLTDIERAEVERIVEQSPLPNVDAKRDIATLIVTLQRTREVIRAAAKDGLLSHDNHKAIAAQGRVILASWAALKLTEPPLPKPPSFDEDDEPSKPPAEDEDDLLRAIKGG